DGGRFGLVVFPFRFQVEAKAPPPSVQEALAAFCARETIPFVDLLPVLRPRGPAAFVDYDHLSAEGAALAAEALAASAFVSAAPSDGEILAGWLEKEHGAAAAAARLWLRDRDERHAAAAVPGLVAALASSDAAVRAAAAWGLETIGSEAQPAVPALRTRLADDASPAGPPPAAPAPRPPRPPARPAAAPPLPPLPPAVPPLPRQAPPPP